VATLPATEHNLKNNAAVIIRSAVESDAAQLIECTKACLRDGAGLITEEREYTRTKDQERVRIRSFINYSNDVLIVVEEPKLKILLGILDFKTGKRKRLEHVGEFGMAVHPDWRRKGVGELLLGALMKFVAERKSVEKINLRVLVSNEAAIALYKKMGFVEEGRANKEIKWPDGTHSDEFIMAKFL
jgi:ribosomal protein S18 acetylase RimI-like enzyme